MQLAKDKGATALQNIRRTSCVLHILRDHVYCAHAYKQAHTWCVVHFSAVTFGRCGELLLFLNMPLTKVCERCSATVNVRTSVCASSTTATCSRDDCQMLQRYDVCPEQLSAKLLFKSGSTFIPLHAYGKILLDITNADKDKINEDMLLQLPTFKSVKYRNNVITSFLY